MPTQRTPTDIGREIDNATPSPAVKKAVAKDLEGIPPPKAAL
jgi:hypothetical protein